MDEFLKALFTPQNIASFFAFVLAAYTAISQWRKNQADAKKIEADAKKTEAETNKEDVGAATELVEGTQKLGRAYIELAEEYKKNYEGVLTQLHEMREEVTKAKSETADVKAVSAKEIADLKAVLEKEIAERKREREENNQVIISLQQKNADLTHELDILRKKNEVQTQEIALLRKNV